MENKDLMGYNIENDKMAKESFLRYFRDFYKRHNDKHFPERFKLYERTMGKPLYNLVFLNKHGFLALKFNHFNFAEKKIVIEANLYTRGLSGKEGGGGQRGQFNMDDVVQRLSNLLGFDVIIVAQPNSVSQKLLVDAHYKSLSEERLTELQKMDQLLRNVPKNSLQAMRIQMLLADNLGIVNSRELQQMTEKYRHTIGMIKVFYPKLIIDKKERDNSFEGIKKDVDLIGELIEKKGK
jgi:hypothetical protein